MDQDRKLTVGIPIIGNASWLGGVSYVELIARSHRLRGEASGVSLALVVEPDTLESLDLHKPFLDAFERILFYAPQGTTPPANPRLGHFHSREDLFRHIDVYFPLSWDVWENQCAVSWIPDFQHRFLPRFFSGADCAKRDADIARIAAHGRAGERTLVLSSRTAERHFREFHPDSSMATEVLSFFASVPEGAFAGDPSATARRYGLPEAYLLCCNQFWAHKDHETLFRAMAQAVREGADAYLACTGAMADYRAPGHYEAMRALVSELGLGSRVKFLGMIPRADQMQLIRRSQAMVQPSLFEGWSTVVEDARSLGKILLLSDLDVHREQNPPGARFFSAGNPGALAALIREAAASLRPGPDAAEEARAREEGRRQAMAYGERFEAAMLRAHRRFIGAKEGSLPPGVTGNAIGTRTTAKRDGAASAPDSGNTAEFREQVKRWFQAGELEPARNALQRRIGEGSRDPEDFGDLGVVLHALGQVSAAVRATAEALALDPDSEGLRNNMLELLREAINPTEPAEDPEATLHYTELAEHFAHSAVDAEIAIEAPNDKPSAAKSADAWEALKNHPLDLHSVLALQAELTREGRLDDAQRLLQGFLDVYPEESALRQALIACEEAWQRDWLQRSERMDEGFRARSFAVTAIVSSYASEAFMRECLEDLEAQTLADDLEIVIVDAASPQDERAIVREFQRRYDNIRYIRTPERIGVYHAWNLAIAASSAPLILPFSTNDRLNPRACEILKRALDENPEVALVYGDSDLTNEPHQVFGRHRQTADFGGRFEWPPYAYEDLLLNCRVGPHPLWRRWVHSEIGYFDGRYKAIGDQDFWLRLGALRPLLHIPEVTGLAWITPESLSGQASAQAEIHAIQEKHQRHYSRARVSSTAQIG